MMSKIESDNKLNINEGLNKSAKELASISLALLSAGTYFFVAHLGAQSFHKLFDGSYIENNGKLFEITAYALSAGACICFGAFSYKAFSNLSLVPKERMSFLLSALAPMSASSFFTACLIGTQAMGIALPLAIALSLILYASRTATMIDGSVKFPEKSKELLSTLKHSLQRRDIPNMLRLVVTLYTAIGFSLASTDNIFSASAFLLGECHVPKGLATDIPSYIIGSLGAAGLFPMVMYWTYRGILQLTRGGSPDENGINQNPTDIYTLVALIATIPVILGSLGSVTSLSGRMFGLLGIHGKIVGVTAAIIYSVGGAVPGLSTILRAIPSLASFSYA